MLRFLSERRAWVIAAFVALTLVIGLWIWGTLHAADRASDVIAERLGVDAHIELRALDGRPAADLATHAAGGDDGLDDHHRRLGRQASARG